MRVYPPPFTHLRLLGCVLTCFVHRGCVVYGRVAGDTAAAYLLQRTQSSADKATSRLASVTGHIQTTVAIDPSANKVKLEFSWGDNLSSSSTPTASAAPAAAPSASGAGSAGGHNPEDTKAAPPPAKAAEKGEAKSDGLKEYTVEEVAKHNSKEDCWVIVSQAASCPCFPTSAPFLCHREYGLIPISQVEGKVLDVTNFLPDHPGGEKAILLYAGRDATEEFLMLHDAKVIPRYAPEATIGVLKK